MSHYVLPLSDCRNRTSSFSSQEVENIAIQTLHRNDCCNLTPFTHHRIDNKPYCSAEEVSLMLGAGPYIHCETDQHRQLGLGFRIHIIHLHPFSSSHIPEIYLKPKSVVRALWFWLLMFSIHPLS